MNADTAVSTTTPEATVRPVTTGRWIAVGKLSDIPLRGARRLLMADRSIALFRTAADRVYAIDNACPHRNGPLSEGIVHGDCVTCPLHNWVISLHDGEVQGVDSGSVKTYPVRVQGESLEVCLPC